MSHTIATTRYVLFSAARGMGVFTGVTTTIAVVWSTATVLYGAMAAVRIVGAKIFG